MRTNRRQFLQNGAVLLAGACSVRLSAAPRRHSRRVHIGCQTNTWGAPIQNYDQLLRILDTLREAGYQGFETNYLSLDARAVQAAECRKAFESRGVRFIAPHTDARLYDRERKEIQALQRIAGYSVRMGASHFIVSGSTLPRADDKLNVSAVHAKAEALNEFGRFCRQEGLRLCYHNHLTEFQDQPSEMSYLLRATDPALVWLNYDVGNHYGVGPDPGAFSAENFRRIAIYHIKDLMRDAGGKTVDTDLGAGKIDLKKVVAPLLDSDWDGWLNVEREGFYPKPAENPGALVRQCREYLKQITGV